MSDPRDHEAINALLRHTFGGHAAWATVLPFREAALEFGRGVLHFFPVDNTAAAADPALACLRATVAKRMGEEEHVRRRVPFPWLSALDRLRRGASKSMPQCGLRRWRRSPWRAGCGRRRCS